MGKETTFKERLRKFAAEQGMSVSELQEKLGVSNAYVYNTCRMSPIIAAKLKKLYPYANIEWINEGIGDMILPYTESRPSPTVPLLPVSAIGGALNDFDTSVMCSNCEKIVSPIDDAKFALTVTGDSMSPEYPNGSIVFVRQVNEASFIEWGKTFVLDTSNGYVIKNVHPSSAKNKIVCRSVNQSYADFEIPTEDIRGWYKVLLVMARK